MNYCMYGGLCISVCMQACMGFYMSIFVHIYEQKLCVCVCVCLDLGPLYTGLILVVSPSPYRSEGKQMLPICQQVRGSWDEY
jgi:hypothetical protein